MKRITESDSNYDRLEEMDVSDLLININKEDQKVAFSVKQEIPNIKSLVNVIVNTL